MCGKKPPKAPLPEPNYEMAREAEQSRLAIAESRAANKQARFEAAFGLNSNRFGRSALMGRPSGFSAPRAMTTPSIPNGQ